MSGLFRNLLTLIQALLARGGASPAACVRCGFWVTPFDCGTRVLKSDKYLQLAEAAQLDFLVKTGLMGPLLRGGIGFVNASQMVRFGKPIAMWARVRMDTTVLYADDKFAYFSHTLHVADAVHAEVLVKMKFKKGRLTVPPADILGARPTGAKPERLQAWDQALES